MDDSTPEVEIRESTPLVRPESVVASTTLDVITFKTYKRRWYVLSLFTAIALVVNMEWNTWGPISEPCEIVFGWGEWQVLFLSSWAAISMILSSFFMTWLMDKRGLRISVIMCAFLTTVGKAFQLIPASDKLTRTILINVGQCVAMFSTPIGLGAPPAISATWFPPAERTTATAIATLVAYLGLSVSFTIGPYMVPVLRRLNTTTNETVYDIQAMDNCITEYMWAQFGISALLLLSAIIYFPSKPKLPPSASWRSQQISYTEGLKTILSDKSYLYLAFMFALSYGVYFGWMAVFSLAVKPFGVGEGLAGWLGCAATIAGCCSGICIARLVDYVKRQTKTVLIILFLGTSTFQLLFSLTCDKLIPFSETLLYASIVFGGLFFNGTTPLLFEMAIETVYPITEGVTAGVLLVGGYFVYLVFVVIFMFPGTDVRWMNWATVLFNGICVPGLLAYKSKFTRLELDEARNE